MTPRTGVTIIGCFVCFSLRAYRLLIRSATVSLRGLNLSWGKVSQAGNSMTLSYSSRSSLTKSSLLRLELVTTNNGCFSARAAKINGNVDEGPTIRCALMDCFDSKGITPRMCCLQCLKAPTSNYPGLGRQKGANSANSNCFDHWDIPEMIKQ